MRYLSPIALALVLCACHHDTAGGTVDGAQIFQDKCAGCHGATGKPDPTLVARLGVKDLSSPEVRARLTPELVAHQVRHGSPNQLMPPFARAMSDAEIEAVAHYVASPAFMKLSRPAPR